jgi:hypothetical protein
MTGSHEVRGSIPLGSTKIFQEIGATVLVAPFAFVSSDGSESGDLLSQLDVTRTPKCGTPVVSTELHVVSAVGEAHKL